MTCDCAFDQFLTALKGALCMPEFPFQSGAVARTYGGVPASTNGTSLTVGATAHTKGGWAELTAATEFTAGWIQIEAGGQTFGTANEWFIDIGVGALGAEQVVIPNLAFVGNSAGESGSWYFPLCIPAGSRISARAQNTVGTSTSCRIAIHLISSSAVSSPIGGGIVSTYGADVGASTGTNIDPGASANTDSAWVEMAAATDRAHNWLGIGLRPGDLSISAARWLLDIALGGAGAEQEILSDVFVTASAAVDRPGFSYIGLPLSIPAGSRLSARVRSSTITDGDRDFNAILYGC